MDILIFISLTHNSAQSLKLKITLTVTYLPMLGFRMASLFWSTLRIVNFWRFPNPLGKNSIKFWDRCRSVRLARPPISSGRSSNRFSEISRQANFFRLPISCNMLKAIKAELGWLNLLGLSHIWFSHKEMKIKPSSVLSLLFLLHSSPHISFYPTFQPSSSTSCFYPHFFVFGDLFIGPQRTLIRAISYPLTLAFLTYNVFPFPSPFWPDCGLVFLHWPHYSHPILTTFSTFIAKLLPCLIGSHILNQFLVHGLHIALMMYLWVSVNCIDKSKKLSGIPLLTFTWGPRPSSMPADRCCNMHKFY